MTLNGTQKRVPMSWDDDAGLGGPDDQGRIRCLGDDDRLQFD